MLVRGAGNQTSMLAMLRVSVPGRPGLDYPLLASVPVTQFSCRNLTAGLYPDPATRCQVPDTPLLAVH